MNTLGSIPSVCFEINDDQLKRPAYNLRLVGGKRLKMPRSPLIVNIALWITAISAVILMLLMLNWVAVLFFWYQDSLWGSYSLLFFDKLYSIYIVVQEGSRNPSRLHLEKEDFCKPSKIQLNNFGNETLKGMAVIRTCKKYRMQRKKFLRQTLR